MIKSDALLDDSDVCIYSSFFVRNIQTRNAKEQIFCMCDSFCKQLFPVSLIMRAKIGSILEHRTYKTMCLLLFIGTQEDKMAWDGCVFL